MRTFVMGDIHGNYRALIYVLELAKFDYLKDKLIILGDVADGYSQVPECIETLMQINNLVWVLGNHDVWAQSWFAGRMDMSGYKRQSFSFLRSDAHAWLSQGGKATYEAYLRNADLIIKHRDFWLGKPVIYHGENNLCFVHAGFDPDRKISSYQWTPDVHVLYWDRNLISKARQLDPYPINFQDGFKRVYIGHTATEEYGIDIPMILPNVTNMDTGAGWHGRLSMMNVYDGEVFNSPRCKDLYPNEIPQR